VGNTRLDFLSREPVSGVLLSDRLAAGPLSPEEALRFARELGSAIHQIHSRGFVHGAICPRSIAIAGSGVRLLVPASAEDKAAYAAPEVLEGKPADARSDIFSYGAVIREAAFGTGDFAAHSPMLAVVERVAAGCLEKDPEQRRQRIQNAVIELKLGAPGVAGMASAPAGLVARRQTEARPHPQTVQAAPIVAKPQPRPAALAQWIPAYPPPFRRRAWILGALGLAVAASGVAAALLLSRKPAAAVLKFAVTQPEHTSYPGMPAVSPDGRYLTFSAVGPEGRRMLWLRPLDALHARVIPGSEGASAPFWSPDSQYVAFFAGRALQKVKIAGGPPEKICDAEAAPGGGAWNKGGTILFAPGLAGGLYRVPAAGGKPDIVWKPDEAKNQRAGLWPEFFPDGKHFLFYQQTDGPETSGVYLGSLDSVGCRRLFSSQTNAVYSAAAPECQSGYLLYINERNLTAMPFQLAKLEIGGDPIVLANEIGAVRSLALAPISVSSNGVLVYQGVGKPTRQMVWLDRSGRQIAVSGEPGEYGPPRVAPDGERGIVAKAGPDGKAHLWILEKSGSAQQISHGEVHEGSPVWSPDGYKVAYFVQQGSAYDVFVRAAVPDSRPEPLLKSATRKYPTDWSRNGNYILFGVEGQGTGLDVWGVSAGDRRCAPILDTVYAEAYGAVSPDGKWLAYQSDQSGKAEVYIQPFDGLAPGTRRRWQVSKGGGLPRWRADGSELFYITEDGCIMAVPARRAADGGIEYGVAQTLFQTRPVPKTWNLYDVAPDGEHFLVNVPLEWTSANPITVVTNWTEKLREY
jgi:Tol biopolymer transport system component